MIARYLSELADRLTARLGDFDAQRSDSAHGSFGVPESNSSSFASVRWIEAIARNASRR